MEVAASVRLACASAVRRCGAHGRTELAHGSCSEAATLTPTPALPLTRALALALALARARPRSSHIPDKILKLSPAATRTSSFSATSRCHTSVSPSGSL